MILISHRGNINGKNIPQENNPAYIDEALREGFDCEIDIRYIKDDFYLGHDISEHIIKKSWLILRIDKLWLHCKNIQAVEYFKEYKKANFFWHENDTLTITSQGYLWVYPGKQPVKNSIAVLPEIHDDCINNCLGICSDFIKDFKQRRII